MVLGRIKEAVTTPATEVERQINEGERDDWQTEHATNPFVAMAETANEIIRDDGPRDGVGQGVVEEARRRMIRRRSRYNPEKYADDSPSSPIGGDMGNLVKLAAIAAVVLVGGSLLWS